jgi:hypothetical protein
MKCISPWETSPTTSPLRTFKKETH